MRILTYRCTQTGHVFPKLGNFFAGSGHCFSIFKKVQGRPPPPLNIFNFLTKFRSSDPSFNSNILKSLYVKFELLRMRNYAITRLYILYKFTIWCQIEIYIEDTLDKWNQ